MAVKWRDWKYWYTYREESTDPDPDSNSRVRLFNLRTDPREETDIKDFNPWVISIMDKLVAEFEESVKEFPNVPRGAEDPYVPPVIKKFSETTLTPLMVPKISCCFFDA